MQRKNTRKKINTEIEIEKRIGEILREGEPSKRLNPELLELWVAQDKEKKKKRLRRNLAIACCCILVFGVSIYGVGRTMGIGPFVATAGEDDKGKVVNVLDKEQEHDGDENVGSEQIIYDSWESVAKAKEKFPELAVPTYVPENFAFCELRVMEENNSRVFLYRWELENNICELQQHKIWNKTLSYGIRSLETNKGTVYVNEEDNKFVTWYFQEYEFNFLGDCSDQTIVEIVEQLKI